ncbi:arsenate reductase (glutaredoxin) [Pseudoalteromonas luteoviolacea]|uniref:arsenate reductase (glutaredoxin) n=1 Tax=Pseudoalteromonas luteoviolacea TaxID=43657 RepID=UPI001B3A6E31|nr:arsenate reductase (glutaredoxin) [Pseudoalteromonas luteoviolacea]MBQ4876572.1 arsenate reductase (glutaredoxin) [Pseudoalteromonas luteoviolacea]MBQ4905203.1 arsenate reductase (glutaredoxin) [Pseudoalteromonas luteoviolacea]
MSVTIYHNPRCSKSRQTLALLEENSIQPEIVEYLKTPIDSETLNTLISKLGFDSAHQLVRNKEAIYKELGLSKDSDETTLRQAMLDNPKLIERPIVVKGDKAALGRPPESVLDII